MHTLLLLVVIGFICRTEGFELKIHYCTFQCSNSCEPAKDESNPNGEAKSPDAFYWRDFYGVIPPDAFPLGPPTQFPQTYIGLVFDPDNNGTFATTIYDGLDYVYNANEGNTTKISSHIQILCTKLPENFGWFKLSKETYQTMKTEGYKVLKAGAHLNSTKTRITHFIVKTNHCHITYIGNVNTIGAELEYALIDGSYQKSNDYMWLMYKKKESNATSEEMEVTPSKSFFSHHYEYQIRPNSIIPKFYKKITIGSCSLTCTNENNGKKTKLSNDMKLASSMAYYWQEGGYVDTELAIPAGKDFVGTISYIGQAPVSREYMYDVGSSDAEGATINFGFANVEEIAYFHVLASNYPDKFKWVNSTTDDFPKLDKDTLIPGGIFKNGTETYVCRTVDDRYGTLYPGSGRVLQSGTFCYSYFGPEETFQVLMYQPQQK